jgi:hypothetical protein
MPAQVVAAAVAMPSDTGSQPPDLGHQARPVQSLKVRIEVLAHLPILAGTRSLAPAISPHGAPDMTGTAPDHMKLIDIATRPNEVFWSRSPGRYRVARCGKPWSSDQLGLRACLSRLPQVAPMIWRLSPAYALRASGRSAADRGIRSSADFDITRWMERQSPAAGTPGTLCSPTGCYTNG